MGPIGDRTAGAAHGPREVHARGIDGVLGQLRGLGIHLVVLLQQMLPQYVALADHVLQAFRPLFLAVTPPPPVQEHARVLIYLRVLVFRVLLFERPPCAVFPA